MGKRKRSLSPLTSSSGDEDQDDDLFLSEPTAPKKTGNRAPPNPNNSTDPPTLNLSINYLLDFTKEIIKRGWDYRIFVKESAYCLACRAVFKNKVSLPNALLGHSRRGKKCIQTRNMSHVVFIGLKAREYPPVFEHDVHRTLPWTRYRALQDWVEENLPEDDGNLLLRNVMPGNDANPSDFRHVKNVGFSETDTFSLDLPIVHTTEEAIREAARRGPVNPNPPQLPRHIDEGEEGSSDSSQPTSKRRRRGAIARVEPTQEPYILPAPAAASSYLDVAPSILQPPSPSSASASPVAHSSTQSPASPPLQSFQGLALPPSLVPIVTDRRVRQLHQSSTTASPSPISASSHTSSNSSPASIGLQAARPPVARTTSAPSVQPPLGPSGLTAPFMALTVSNFLPPATTVFVDEPAVVPPPRPMHHNRQRSSTTMPPPPPEQQFVQSGHVRSISDGQAYQQSYGTYLYAPQQAAPTNSYPQQFGDFRQQGLPQQDYHGNIPQHQTGSYTALLHDPQMNSGPHQPPYMPQPQSQAYYSPPIPQPAPLSRSHTAPNMLPQYPQSESTVVDMYGNPVQQPPPQNFASQPVQGDFGSQPDYTYQNQPVFVESQQTVVDASYNPTQQQNVDGSYNPADFDLFTDLEVNMMSRRQARRGPPREPY